MKLEFKKFGHGDPLLIVHGLYGSGDNWFTIGRNLKDLFTVYLVDLRNHGDSPHASEISVDLMTADLEELFESENLNKASLMGHSLGGKVVMNFTLRNPEKVSKLVIIDVALRSYSTPGDFAPQTQEHQKIIEALAALKITGTTERSAIDKQLSREVHSKSLRQFLLKNLKRHEDGSFYWGLNIEAVRKNMLQLLDAIETEGKLFNNPVLVVYGKRSGYISENDFPEFLKVFPDAQFKAFETGHWVHAEQPEKLITLLRAFLPE